MKTLFCETRVARICGSRRIYSSQTTQWRKLRDAGVLEGKKPGVWTGRLSPEQAEEFTFAKETKPDEIRRVLTDDQIGLIYKGRRWGWEDTEARDELATLLGGGE
ncbi:MAG TPA: hypothetical protein VIM08_01375 [Arthrobacter sp.]|jgi:hypothetical protein